MLVVEMSDPSKPSKAKEDLQDPGEAQGPGEGSHSACCELLWGPQA